MFTSVSRAVLLETGVPRQPQGEGAHVSGGVVRHWGLQCFTLCTVVVSGVWLATASPSPHWGCQQLRGAFQLQKSPHECLPSKTIQLFSGNQQDLGRKAGCSWCTPRRGSHTHTSAPCPDRPADSGLVRDTDGRLDTGMPNSNQGGGMTGEASALWVCVWFPNPSH